MKITKDFPYPKDEYVQMLKDFYAGFNGPDSMQPEQEWQGDTWSSKVFCSRGSVFEKAGFSRMHIAGGTIEGVAASLSFMETIAYPANHRVPGFIIMTNMNEKEEIGRTLVFYADLIEQAGELQQEDRELFSGTVKSVCDRYGHDFNEMNGFAAGQNLLGGIAAEAGFLYFFQENDVPFCEEIIRAMLGAYEDIVERRKDESAGDHYVSLANRNRARLVEWIIRDDYGIKIAKENGVPMEFIEAYAFPPVVRY